MSIFELDKIVWRPFFLITIGTGPVHPTGAATYGLQVEHLARHLKYVCMYV